MENTYLYQNESWANYRTLVKRSKRKFAAQFNPKPPLTRLRSKAIWLQGSIEIHIWVA